MVGRLSMEQAREIRARRELAQELGAWSYARTHRKRDDIYAITCLDDVQKFERAIVSGKPFETESKRNIDDANDASDPGSDSTSAREPPKVVCVHIVPTPTYSD